MSRSATVRLVEIAELLGVSKQRAHQIAEEKGFPAPLAETPVAEFGAGTRCRRGRSLGAARNPGVSRRSAIEIRAAAIPRSGLTNTRDGTRSRERQKL